MEVIPLIIGCCLEPETVHTQWILVPGSTPSILSSGFLGATFYICVEYVTKCKLLLFTITVLVKTSTHASTVI